MKTWVGTVTQLMPPNYGIVDGIAFYVDSLVVGRPLKVSVMGVRLQYAVVCALLH